MMNKDKKIIYKIHLPFIFIVQFCISKINNQTKFKNMKTKLLIGAAFLFSATAFAQSPGTGKQKNRHNHGTDVSTVAKSETEGRAHGTAVSTTASGKAQASVNRKNQTAEEREMRRAERESNRDTRKQEHKDVVAGIKADAKAHGDDGFSGMTKAEMEARKELKKTEKEQAKSAREAAKADRKRSDNDLLNSDTRIKVGKADRTHRPAKVKGSGKVHTGVQLNRPKVGAKVRGSAGLGIL